MTMQQLLKKLNEKETELSAKKFRPEGYIPGKRMAQTRFGSFKEARKKIKSGSRNLGIYWDPVKYTFLVKGKSNRKPGWQTIIEIP